MIELSLSAFAWAGVVLFQAIVHYTVRTQKRKMGRGDCGDPQPALEASPLVLELAFTPEQIGKEGGARDHCPRTHAVAAAASHVVSDELFQDEIDPLDGDEPPVFFELLSQTGCEMMRNVSIESIVLEQMHEDDHASIPQHEPSQFPLVTSE